MVDQFGFIDWNKHNIETDVGIFTAMVLGSIVALIFFGLIAFIIGVSVYVIADMIISCKDKVLGR